MQKTLIVYESKYGSTKEIVDKMSLILGPALSIRPGDFAKEHKAFDLYVIISPIYSESISENILKFILDNKHWLEEKKVVLICTCLIGEKGICYIKKLKDILGDCVMVEKSIGGRMDLSTLDEDDYETLKAFSERVNFPLKSCETITLREVINTSMEIKGIRDSMVKRVPENKLKFHVEEFLKCHNTCTLSTASGDFVRGTPIEYTYNNGCIYLVTEGGEKYANLLLNRNVSIAIYDEYESMVKLAGMQIKGRAELIEHGSREYRDALGLKGLNIENVISLPMRLNIIRIKMEKAEFLYSKFKTLGYDPKQVYIFGE